VGIDALAITSTTEQERGGLNGWMQVGYLGSRGLFGGGALLVRERWGDSALVALLVLAIALPMTTHLFCRLPAGRAGERAGGPAAAFLDGLRAALRARRTWIALLFAALVASALEATGAVSGPLLVELGFSDARISTFYALPVPLGLAVGALLGGWFSDRRGRRRAVAFAGLFVAAAVTLLALAPLGVERPTFTFLLLGGVYLGAGLLTASTYALFMDLTQPGLAATQFSAYMAATNLCELWSGRLAGRLAGGSGYPSAFLATAAVTATALLLLVFLSPHPRPPIPDRAPKP
jgi:predicted MFS family arabinose efflux permease